MINRKFWIICVFLVLAIPVTADAFRIEILGQGKMAFSVNFVSGSSPSLTIEKNISYMSDTPYNSGYRVTSQIFYNEQILTGALGLRLTRFPRLSSGFGYYGQVQIIGAYDTEYDTFVDAVTGTASGGLFNVMGDLKPWISAIYNYHYDIYYKEGLSVFGLGIGVELDLSEHFSVQIKGEGILRGVNTDYHFLLTYHSW